MALSPPTISAPTIEACGKNKAVNWLVLVLPKIDKSITEDNKTYQLKRAFIVRHKVRHRKNPRDLSLEPVIIGNRVIEKYRRTTVPGVGTLLLDSQKPELRDGTYAYSVIARYANTTDDEDFKWGVSPLSEVVAF